MSNIVQFFATVEKSDFGAVLDIRSDRCHPKNLAKSEYFQTVKILSQVVCVASSASGESRHAYTRAHLCQSARQGMDKDQASLVRRTAQVSRPGP
jgi:hypothetical protein